MAVAAHVMRCDRTDYLDALALLGRRPGVKGMAGISASNDAAETDVGTILEWFGEAATGRLEGKGPEAPGRP